MAKATLIRTASLAALVVTAWLGQSSPLTAADPGGKVAAAPTAQIIGDQAARFIPLGVGKSIVIDLPGDIKDVLVADPKIANAVVRTSRRAYIIGVAGSVAVGKSTTSRIMQALLARWTNVPKVELVTTDGFLLPNAVLQREGLMEKKGFPESYDTRRLLDFLRAVKSGEPEVTVPVYSHVIYDVLPDVTETVHQPDILILEGLNVLQIDSRATEFVSDYFDFSIYLDARESLIESWFVERFHALRRTVFQDPESFFRHFADLSDDQASALAHQIWESINGRNLRENIVPSKGRASLVVEKGEDHRVTDVFLRKL